MSCKYCEINDDPYSDNMWHGENFELLDLIDGSGQNFEAAIQDNIDHEQKVLNLDGTHSNFVIRINYCPMCGERL